MLNICLFLFFIFGYGSSGGRGWLKDFKYDDCRVTVNGMEGNGNSMYGGGGPMGYGPLSGTTTTTDTSLIPPMHGTSVADSIPVKTPMKSDSGLTYPIPVSRKRTRDNNAGIPDNRLLAFPQNHQQNSGSNRCGSFTFLGQDISFQIQQQQFEIDRFISQHVRSRCVTLGFLFL